MLSIVLYNGERVWCVDGVWYHVPDRASGLAPVDVEFEMVFWKKVNPLRLPVWLALHMSNSSS